MQALDRRNHIIGKNDWLRGIILVIAWVLIISLAKDLWQVRKGFTRIEEAKVRLEEETKRNTDLKIKLGMVSTDEYKERIIREQLNMQKVGEIVAVLPTDDLKTSQIGEVEEAQMENWQKWWALLK
jgi:hypothetical protein